jgi:hypothetical protein
MIDHSRRGQIGDFMSRRCLETLANWDTWARVALVVALQLLP